MPTKQPKSKSPKDKQPEEKKRTRTRTDKSKISKCLMLYSAARVATDEAIHTVKHLNIDEGKATTSYDITVATNKIRLALKEIRSAKVEIRDEMKMNDWVRSMIDHLTTWENTVDSSWEVAQKIAEGID